MRHWHMYIVSKFQFFSRVVLFLLMGHFTQAYAQVDTLRVSLKDVIALAQSDAPNVLLAKTLLTNRYWRYQSLLADLSPQIRLDAFLPNFNRSIQPITLPDGRDAFVNRSLMNNSLELSLRQDIALTGGTVSIGTGLRRIDIFSENGSNAISYLSNPLFLNINQPLFGFNSWKWNKQIEPLRFEEAQKKYSEDMEQVALDAASLFFQLLIAQLNLEAARKDKVNADTLYAISEGRFGVGRIAEPELLQIELSARNADAAMAQAMLDRQTQTERLRNFLGIERQIHFILIPPSDIPIFTPTPDKALESARAHRSKVLELRRRRIEAQRDVAEAKGNNGLRIGLDASVGLSQTGSSLSDVYNNTLDQEVIGLNLGVPIADWGKARARRSIAESNQQYETVSIRQEEIAFEREVLIKAQQFSLLRDQVALAARSLEVAQKRQDMTRNRYYIGKIGITELNIAVSEQDAARRAYAGALQNYWLAYYELRFLTLYDFERNEPLLREAEKF